MPAQIHTDPRHALKVSLASQLLSSFGRLRLRAVGSSMVPAIFPGDLLTIRRQRPAELRVGDMVLCARGDRFFIHRLVGQAKPGGTSQWLLRGDALTESDPPAGEAELLGRVIEIERGVHKWSPIPLTGRSWLLSWCVRRSNLLLRILLYQHARRYGAAQTTAPRSPLFLEEQC